MNFGEALKLMKRGKRVRRKTWDDWNVFLQDGRRLVSSRSTPEFPYLALGDENILAEDWEEYRPEKPGMDFGEALKAMKRGKEIRRSVWRRGVRMSSYSLRMSLQIDDILADDWMEVGA